MMIKPILLAFIFSLSSLFLFAQKKEIKSILTVKPKVNFDIFSFNISFKKELNSSILAVYNFEDLERGNFVIRTSYFNKPISKYAFENFREMELYKRILPKPMDLINFQRYINNCPR